MKKPVILFDLDGTLADFDGAILRDLQALHNPAEGPFDFSHTGGNDDNDPKWLKARKDMIKRQPDWWLNLEPIESGFKLMKMARDVGFRVVICSRGPASIPDAWAQKVKWVQKHVERPRKITLADEKDLVYGRILVDDWPDYVTPWLGVRPRGHVLMPAHRWNKNYQHPRALRYDGTNWPEVQKVLESQFTRLVCRFRGAVTDPERCLKCGNLRSMHK